MSKNQNSYNPKITKMSTEKEKAIVDQILQTQTQDDENDELQLKSLWSCVICNKYGFSVGRKDDNIKINGKWGQCEACYGICCQHCYTKCWDKDSKISVIVCKECVKECKV